MRTNRGPGNTTPALPSEPEASPETITLPNGRTVPVPRGRVFISCRRGKRTLNGVDLTILPAVLEASEWNAEEWLAALSDPFVKVIQAA